MKITITGKELQATDAIKDYVEKKVQRIEKYFANDLETMEVNVTIKAEKNVKNVEQSLKWFKIVIMKIVKLNVVENKWLD